MNRTFLLTLILLILAPTNLLLAQRDLKNIPPPDPELERKTFEVAEGFEVNLFAAEPMLAKPIQMNFDSKGRLWIASSEVYPHIKPGQKANDKIVVLEDSDGDGKCDQSHTFAEGLLIPTGVLPGDGGCYVANSTELVFFADENNDLKADFPNGRTVLSGFGTEDTHHILHTLRWGHDGCMYFNQSIYIHSHIETPYGVKRLGGGGIWRFRPETMELDVFARGLINPWGHQIDAYGQSFATDGAGGEGINYMIPGAAYRTAVGVPRVVNGLNPGSPKYCGLEIVSGPTLPEDWQNSLITCDFRGHRVCRFTLSENGAGYSSQQQADVIRSNHVAFRPIDIAMGPDGAIYIADWYNPIIQHGEVDFRDDRRDHTHGRIWRVIRKDASSTKVPDFANMKPDELLDQLLNNNQKTRDLARRVIKNQQAEALRDGQYEEFNKYLKQHLDNWLSNLESKHATKTINDYDQLRLEALWTYQAIRNPENSLLISLLKSDDGRIRAAAIRVAIDWKDQIADPLALLKPFIEDSHPRVRLEAVRAVAQLENAESIEAATLALNRPMDRFLEYALWLTTWQNRNIWLEAYRNGEIDFRNDPKVLLYLATAFRVNDLVVPLAELVNKPDAPISKAERTAILSFIAETGSPQDLRRVLNIALKKETTADVAANYLNILNQAARTKRKKPTGNLAEISELFSSQNEGLAIVAIQCAGAWKLQSLNDQFVGLAINEKRSAVQMAATNALADLATTQARQALLDLAMKDESLQTRLAATVAFIRIDATKAATLAKSLLEVWPEKDALQTEPIFQAFLSIKNGTVQLAKEINSAKLNSEISKTGLSVIARSGQKFDGLASALTKAGGITLGPKQFSQQEMDELVAMVRAKADLKRGELIYRRDDLQCQKCHAIGGAGGKVGPDFTSLGGSAQIDYLIQSLYDPNAKVKENYHSVVIATKEGKVFSGIKLQRTDTVQVLRTADDKEIEVPISQIDEEVPGISLMPPGLVDKLPKQDVIDLVGFLSALGRVQEFSIKPGTQVRHWNVMSATNEAAYRLRRTSHTQATTDDTAFTWKPAYSKVSGELPLSDLPEVGIRRRSEKGTYGFSFAYFDIEVTQPGQVGLSMNETTGLELWVNSDPLKVKPFVQTELNKGKHRITISVDRSLRKNGISISLKQLPDSKGRAEIVR